MNAAFIFPGQASQYVGMGLDLYESDKLAQVFFDRADTALPFDLLKVCFEGPEEELKQTRITQPAIFVHSIVVELLLRKRGASFQMTAGHSLGEYSALVATGVMDFDNALEIVALRGELMQNAGNERPGAMAAVMGMKIEQVEKICIETSVDGEVVVPANINAPGQIVVSGDVVAVQRAMESSKNEGAKKVVRLVVSGAFHSPLMKPAADTLADKLNGISLRPPKVPVYMNVTGEPVLNHDTIRQRLVEQLTHPVRWEDTIRNMAATGINRFIEVGPGKVLQGLSKRIAKEALFEGVDKFEDVKSCEIN